MKAKQTTAALPQGSRNASPETDSDSEEPPGSRSPSLVSGRRRAEARLSGRAYVRSPRSLEATRLTEEQTNKVASLGIPTVLRPLEDVRHASLRVSYLRQLQVFVLYSLALGLERGRPEDKIADEETSEVASAIAASLEGHVRTVELVPVWDDLPSVLRQFDPRQHVVFNLVESLGGRAFTEPEPPRILEAMGFVFTGANYRSLQRSANKLTTKQLLEAAGLPTPRYQVFRQNGGHRTFKLSLPVIVKPVAEGGSFGITQDSLISEREALPARVQNCLDVYRQPVLVEEYIAGREINVALWGNDRPKVLPISEIRFDWTQDPLRQFVTFNSKWVVASVEYTGTPGICPAPLAPEEEARIKAVAGKAYRALGARGYARVDMRLRDGTPYILEVNTNPDLAPDAGFFRSAAAAGYNYTEMLLRILQLAVASQT